MQTAAAEVRVRRVRRAVIWEGRCMMVDCFLLRCVGVRENRRGKKSNGNGVL